MADLSIDERDPNYFYAARQQIVLSTTVDADLLRDAKAEIEVLRAALALAVGELSTYGPYRYTSPDQLMQAFLEEARRG